jgi:GTPase
MKIIKVLELEIRLDLKITLIGALGVGKSTLLGVLMSGKLDDGLGQSRTTVLTHKHEILDGRTSSVKQ